MHWLQRLIVRIAARLVPPLGRVLQSAGGTVERLYEQNQMYRERLSDEQSLILQEINEYREAMAMAGGGWSPRMREGAVSTDYTLKKESDSLAVVHCKERLAELELALEDRGWKRQLALAATEFSRYGIQQIILISRLYFIKHPLIQRGVKVSSHYVFGRGIEVSSPDESANEVLQAFFADPRNANEISHTGLVRKEEGLHTDGNLFWSLHTAVDDGQTIIRQVDALEIEEIITDPNDQAVPWFYHRRWTQVDFDPNTGTTQVKPMDAWYIALGYQGKPPAKIKGNSLWKDTNGMLVPILHVKVGGISKWHFGCPMVYAALDWARAYRHFLEDWATITRQLARFSWQVETQGGIPAIAAFKQTLATTLGNDGTNIETNPAPVTGSAWITGPGNKLAAIRTAGATTEPEQGRRVMLMVAAAFGLPETFFGDASTGSLATAQSLDRPTELKFLEAQERWREVLQRIGHYVLTQSLRAPSGKLREAIKSRGLDPDAITIEMTPKHVPGGTVWTMVEAKKVTKVANQTAIVIDVKFPSVLEHDITSRVTAIVDAMTLNGFECTGIDERIGVGLLLEELGVEDVQAVIEAMYPDKAIGDGLGYEPDRTIPDPEPVPADPTGAAPGAKGAPPNAPKPRAAHPKRTNAKASEATVARAVAELRRTLVKLQERGKVNA